MVAIRSEVRDLLQRLGVSPDQLTAQITAMGDRSLRALKSLGPAGLDPETAVNKFGRNLADARIEIPPFGYNPGPKEALADRRRYLAPSYHRHRDPTHPSSRALFTHLFKPRRRNAVKLGRLVHTNRMVRAAFERNAGAKVVLNRRSDGDLTMRPTREGLGAQSAQGGVSVGAMTAPPSSDQLLGLFSAMEEEILRQAWLVQAAQQQQDQRGASGGVGAVGTGLGWTSGLGALIGADPVVSSALEGGVVSPAPNNTSIDIETLRLKRMLDKREQMITAVKNVFDKWNQSAKGVIDNVRA